MSLEEGREIDSARAELARAYALRGNAYAILTVARLARRPR